MSSRWRIIGLKICSNPGGLPRVKKKITDSRQGKQPIAPYRGNRQSTPDRGNSQSTPDRGNSQSTPDRGNSQSTPDRGNSQSTPLVDSRIDRHCPDSSIGNRYPAFFFYRLAPLPIKKMNNNSSVLEYNH